MNRREFIAGLGGAAGWPLLVRAQPQMKPVIGVLDNRPGLMRRELHEAFLRGLAEVGVSEGGVTIEYHTTDGHYERLSALAADVVRRRPAVILAVQSVTALAGKAATQDIPIIFLAIDPVELGLVASFNRPGGNVTGITFGVEIVEKRLELLHKAVPPAETVGLLVGPADSTGDQAETRHAQSAAHTLGLRLLVFNITTDADVTPAFATLVEHQAGTIIVGASLVVGATRDQILSHAARLAPPTMFAYGIDAQAGGLLSYGPDFIEISRQIGAYTGRILKGEKPADLPVVQPTKFELVINLKTAKALGLTIPPTLLALADEVIE
jgi:putative tryptophan/tyrosine transport system substrate-binding protein